MEQWGLKGHPVVKFNKLYWPANVSNVTETDSKSGRIKKINIIKRQSNILLNTCAKMTLRNDFYFLTPLNSPRLHKELLADIFHITVTCMRVCVCIWVWVFVCVCVSGWKKEVRGPISGGCRIQIFLSSHAPTARWTDPLRWNWCCSRWGAAHDMSHNGCCVWHLLGPADVTCRQQWIHFNPTTWHIRCSGDGLKVRSS